MPSDPWLRVKEVLAAVLEERADDDGAFFRVRGDQETLSSLREQLAQA